MMKKIENYEQTKDKALRLLTFRAHSEKELTDKLKTAGASAENIEETLEFCRRYKFVDDLSYAKSKARDLQNLKKYGKRRIEAELYSKGISGEMIEEALSELDFENSKETLLPLVERKLNHNFEKKSIDRCIRYFMYRGYDLNDVKKCIEELQTGEADEL